MEAADALTTLGEVSPRHNRRRRDEDNLAAASTRGLDTVEQWPDGEWSVRHVTGSASDKTYRCPGCDQEIPGNIGHVVAWPADGLGGPEHRRHWHTPCWQARSRRGPRAGRTFRG